MSEQLDLALCVDARNVWRACALGERTAAIAQITRLPLPRVAECLSWLQKRGDVEWRDTVQGGEWRTT